MDLSSSTFGDCSMPVAHFVAPRITKHEWNWKFSNPPDAKVSQRSVWVRLINHFVQNFENNWEVLKKIKTLLNCLITTVLTP